MRTLITLTFAAFIAFTVCAQDFLGIFGLASYQVHYGASSRGTNEHSRGAFRYGHRVSFPKTQLTATTPTLAPGVWYFSATATASNGVAGNFSNELTWTNQHAGPVRVRITGPPAALRIQFAP